MILMIISNLVINIRAKQSLNLINNYLVPLIEELLTKTNTDNILRIPMRLTRI